MYTHDCASAFARVKLKRQRAASASVHPEGGSKFVQEKAFQQNVSGKLISTTCFQRNNFRITLFKHGVERVVVVPRCSGATLRPEASIQNKSKHNDFNSIQNKTILIKRIQFKTERNRQAVETLSPEARLVESVDETDLYRHVTYQIAQLS